MCSDLDNLKWTAEGLMMLLTLNGPMYWGVNFLDLALRGMSLAERQTFWPGS